MPDSLQRKTQSEAARGINAASQPRGLRRKLAYGLKIFPSYAWQRLVRHVPRGRVHLILALADHFEPAIVPGDGRARASYQEQEQRLERWCREYPKVVDAWRDSHERAFVHTYFYPAEQYDRGLVSDHRNYQE